MRGFLGALPLPVAVAWRGLSWAWGFERGSSAAVWYNWPLTWMTHQADCQAYGLWPGGHHVTNVILHACGTVAFFAFVRCLPLKVSRGTV